MGGSGRDDEAWRGHTRGLRRERLMRAMVQVVCEQRGFAGASLTALCAHAKISRAAFYEVFDSRESCFLAVLDEGYRRVTAVALAAIAETDNWLDGARGALAAVLWFFDSEPELTRVCLVEALAAGPWALERRQLHVAGFLHTLAERSGELAPPEPHSLANTGIVASVVATIEDHLLRRNPDPLVGLLGPLTGLIAAPYMDARLVAGEVERASTLAAQMLADGHGKAVAARQDRPAQVPKSLLDPRAHRARQCVLYLADHPGASNREIGRAVGIARDPQVSKTLAQLANLGLLEKGRAKPGGPNAWRLTARGGSVARLLDHTR